MVYKLSLNKAVILKLWLFTKLDKFINWGIMVKLHRMHRLLVFLASLSPSLTVIPGPSLDNPVAYHKYTDQATSMGGGGGVHFVKVKNTSHGILIQVVFQNDYFYNIIDKGIYLL